MKQFVKALNKDRSSMENIMYKLPGLPCKILRQEFSMVPEQKTTNDPHFISLNEIKSFAYISFVLVIKNFLGNKMADNYTQLVENMLFCS